MENLGCTTRSGELSKLSLSVDTCDTLLQSLSSLKHMTHAVLSFLSTALGPAILSPYEVLKRSWTVCGKEGCGERTIMKGGWGQGKAGARLEGQSDPRSGAP